jgi:hypothetical protein
MSSLYWSHRPHRPAVARRWSASLLRAMRCDYRCKKCLLPHASSTIVMAENKSIFLLRRGRKAVQWKMPEGIRQRGDAPGHSAKRQKDRWIIRDWLLAYFLLAEILAKRIHRAVSSMRRNLCDFISKIVQRTRLKYGLRFRLSSASFLQNSWTLMANLIIC